MMPRGGMPMMGMGRGGFPPHGPPMDYFYPYMEEGMGYYGGGRPPFHAGPGMMGVRRFSHGHAPYEEGFDDYEDELRAFSRKREWEKEREKRKERKKRRSTSSEGEESDSEDSSSRRKKKSKVGARALFGNFFRGSPGRPSRNSRYMHKKGIMPRKIAR